MATIIPEPTLMDATAKALGLDEFDGETFSGRVESVIARDNRQLTFVFNDGAEITIPWHRRKPMPYSKIGIEKRAGRNICYSIIGRGNGKVGERRKRAGRSACAELLAHATGKEAEENAKSAGNSSEKT